VDFVASFSGGKDSTLAIINMVKKRHRLIAIIVSLDQDESWIHGIGKEFFERFSEIFNSQIIYVDSKSSDYEDSFVKALIKARCMGAQACVFGDINIENHLMWNRKISDRAGMLALHPLEYMTSISVVKEVIKSGIKAKIVKVDTAIDSSFVGRYIDENFVEDFISMYPSADICGENGEYHTCVEIESIRKIVTCINIEKGPYFDNASTCFPKAPGIGGVCLDFINKNSYSVSRGTFKKAYELSSDIMDHRCDMVNFFDAEPKEFECIFSSSATGLINMVLFGYLKKGDHIILDNRLHNSAWRVANKLEDIGIEVEYLPPTSRVGDKSKNNLYDKLKNKSEGKSECSSDEMVYRLEDIKRMVKENTKMVFLTLVDNIGGSYIVDMIDDYDGFLRLVESKKIVLVADGVQASLERQVSIDKLGIDVLIVTSHIGLMGLEGLAYLIGRKEVLGKIDPLVYGGTGSQSNLETMPQILPDKFEVGTINTVAINGAKRALDYIKDQGEKEIIAKKHRLANRLRRGLSQIDDLRVLGSGSFCLVLPQEKSNLDMSMLMFMLDMNYKIKARVGVQCSKMANDYYKSSHGGIRFSIGYFNTEEEVDYLIDSMKKIVDEYR